ncbi:MAG: ATP-binding cassette domain-containing protein [Luteolibacter sp.]
MSGLVKISNLRKTYIIGEFGFSLHVPRLAINLGQVSVFQGASGCGKSTLFDMIGLISRPDSADEFVVSDGGISVDARQSSEALRTRLRASVIGYVLQHSGLIPSLTVEENILLPFRLDGERPDRNRLEQLTVRLGIHDHLRKKPAHLSGGQLQRAAIARALIRKPSLILADEPTGQLDVFTATDVRDLLLSVSKEENSSLLIVTHDPELFRSSADRCFTFDYRKSDKGYESTLRELPALSALP